MNVMLRGEQECKVELLYKKHFMVEKSAPQTGLLSVTQNHVPMKDFLLSTANGVHGVTVTLPVDQEFKIEPFWSKPNMMGRTVLEVIPWSATSTNHVRLTVNWDHGVTVVKAVDLEFKKEKSRYKQNLVERSVVKKRLRNATSNNVQKTVNGGHGANVVLPVDPEQNIEKLKNQPNLVERSVLGMRLRIVTSNYASEPASLTVYGGHGVNVVLNVDLGHEIEKSREKPNLVEKSALGLQ